MYYDVSKIMKKAVGRDWPEAKNYINAYSLYNNSRIKIPILSDNMLITGKTGFGKSTIIKEVTDVVINDEIEPFTMFLEIKDDFQRYIRPKDKVVSFCDKPNYNCFKWNLIQEIRQSDDWNSTLEAIATILFSDLMVDSRNRFWVEGAKGIFKGFINVILHYYDNSPSNQSVIGGMKYMTQTQLIEHLSKYKPNRSILRDYLGYDIEHPEKYVQPKRTGDIMAFLAVVLEKFDGTFYSSDGTDTIHDFLNGNYGKRLFLLYDYSKRSACTVFFRLILQRIIEERLSQQVDRSKKVVLILDEAPILESDFGLMSTVTIGRGNNLQVILSTQSLEKLYCIAPELNAEHITNSSLAGFPTIITYQPGDPKTIEILQKLFGNKQKQIMTMPLSRYAQPQFQYVTEPIIKEEDLSSLGVGECYVKIKNYLPQRVQISTSKYISEL